MVIRAYGTALTAGALEVDLLCNDARLQERTSKSFEHMPLNSGTEWTITAFNGRWERPIRTVVIRTQAVDFEANSYTGGEGGNRSGRLTR
jgi:hypothetical protein